MSELRDDLVQRLRNNRLVVLAGTGVSIQAAGAPANVGWIPLISQGVQRAQQLDPTIRPDWGADLLRALSSESLDEILGVAEQVSGQLGYPHGPEWGRWLRDEFRDIKVQDRRPLAAIKRLRVPVATTNYDELLIGEIGGRAATWRHPERIQRILDEQDQGIIHLHGYWDEPESVVLGLRSYFDVTNDGFTQLIQQSLVTRYSVLFVGTDQGLNDPNWKPMVDLIRTTLAKTPHRHFFLCRTEDVAESAKRFKDSRIYAMSYGDKYEDLPGFLWELARDAGRRPARLPGGPTAKTTARPAPASVGLGVVVRANKVVLEHRDHGDGIEWSFPGGFIRQNDDPAKAAQRKVEEETGLEVSVTKELGRIARHPTTRLPTIYFAMESTGDLTNLQPEENISVEWVDTANVYDYIPKDKIARCVRDYLTARSAQ